jgi:hypothetical protein
MFILLKLKNGGGGKKARRKLVLMAMSGYIIPTPHPQH